MYVYVYSLLYMVWYKFCLRIVSCSFGALNIFFVAFFHVISNTHAYSTVHSLIHNLIDLEWFGACPIYNHGFWIIRKYIMTCLLMLSASLYDSPACQRIVVYRKFCLMIWWTAQTKIVLQANNFDLHSGMKTCSCMGIKLFSATIISCNQK